jgi:hypothetical protein
VQLHFNPLNVIPRNLSILLFLTNFRSIQILLHERKRAPHTTSVFRIHTKSHKSILHSYTMADRVPSSVERQFPSRTQDSCIDVHTALRLLLRQDCSCAETALAVRLHFGWDCCCANTAFALKMQLL